MLNCLAYPKISKDINVLKISVLSKNMVLLFKTMKLPKKMALFQNLDNLLIKI